MRPRRPERPRHRLQRLRTLRWPILETAGAAVVAWYLAKLLLSGEETAFAPIAAIICLGATFGQQRQRALELTGGVVVGVLIADLLVRLLGSGPLQVGLMVVLAMSAAVLLGGGTLLMVEAGVSAVIIGSTAATGLIPLRPVEALIGGGVAFVVHLLVFPPNPRLLVGRAANDVFDGLGSGLKQLAGALRTGDRMEAERALDTMRGMDADVRALADALEVGRDTARSAPLRWTDRAMLERQDDISRYLDHAVRDARVLARDVVRYARAGGPPVPEVGDAVAHLAGAIWAVAASFDEPGDGGESRGLALQAARLATKAMVQSDDLTLVEIAGQVRSTAVDLARAAQAGAGEDPGGDESTEELLAVPSDEEALAPPRPHPGEP